MTEPTRLDDDLLDTYAWTSEGAFLVAATNGRLLRFTDLAAPPETIGRFPGRIEWIEVGHGGRLAVVTSENGSAEEPHLIHLVDERGGSKATFEVASYPDGFAWSPDGDALAFGDELGITVLTASGKVSERGRCDLPSVLAWDAVGIVFSHRGPNGRVTGRVMRPRAARRFWQPRFTTAVSRRFWPSPDASVAVCVARDGIRVRGVEGAVALPASSFIEVGYPPQWIGSRHIVLGAELFDVERQRFVSADTPNRPRLLTGPPDGTRMVWKEHGTGRWWWSSFRVRNLRRGPARGIAYWISACERISPAERDRFLVDIVRAAIDQTRFREYCLVDPQHELLVRALEGIGNGSLDAETRARSCALLRQLAQQFGDVVKYEWEAYAAYNLVLAMTRLLDDEPNLAEPVLRGVGAGVDAYESRSDADSMRPPELPCSVQIACERSFPRPIDQD